jgi:hypothetical protein
MASRDVNFGRRLSESGHAATSASNTGAVTAALARADPRAKAVAVRADRLVVEFVDGRTLWVPLDRFPRLVHASPKERDNFQLFGDGSLIHWPDVDEDIDVPNLLLE